MKDFLKETVFFSGVSAPKYMGASQQKQWYYFYYSKGSCPYGKKM